MPKFSLISFVCLLFVQVNFVDGPPMDIKFWRDDSDALEGVTEVEMTSAEREAAVLAKIHRIIALCDKKGVSSAAFGIISKEDSGTKKKMSTWCAGV